MFNMVKGMAGKAGGMANGAAKPQSRFLGFLRKKAGKAGVNVNGVLAAAQTANPGNVRKALNNGGSIPGGAFGGRPSGAGGNGPPPRTSNGNGPPPRTSNGNGTYINNKIIAAATAHRNNKNNQKLVAYLSMYLKALKERINNRPPNNRPRNNRPPNNRPRNNRPPNNRPRNKPGFFGMFKRNPKPNNRRGNSSQNSKGTIQRFKNSAAHVNPYHVFSKLAVPSFPY